jgi:hypothetical protein
MYYDARLTKHYLNAIGAACSAYGGEERRIQCFGGHTGWKETTWEAGVDVRGILNGY